MRPEAGFRNTAAILVAALMVASCTVGPDYEAPQLDVPERFVGSAADAPAAAPAALEHWWTLLHDPCLIGIVEHARANNLDLAAALWRVEANRATRAIARGEWFPAIDGTGGYEHSRLSGNGPFAPPAVPTPGGAAVTPGVSNRNLTSIGLDASWEIDVFGRIRRAVEASDADLSSAVEQARDVQVIVLAEAGSAYIEAVTLRERLIIAEANATAQSQTLALTRSRVQAELSPALDVAQAESNLALTRAEIPALRAQLDAALFRLDFVLGEAPGFTRAIVDASVVPFPPALSGLGVPRDVLVQRPDIRSSERRLAAETARIGMATADLYPRFSLSGGYGYESLDGSQTLDSDSRTFRIGPSFRWNLFDGGRIRSAIHLQDARAEQARVELEGVVLRALREIETSVSSHTHERERLMLLEEAARAAAAAAGYVRDLYREGLADFQNVLDAERTLFRAQDLAAVSRGAVALTWIRVYRSLGGGWSEADMR